MIISIDDMRERARRRLPGFVFDFMEGGTEGEHCLRRNRETFERVRLLPRYLVDITSRKTTCELFGRTWAAPFGIAPTGMAGLVWPGADLARARAAASLDIPFIFPVLSSERLEDVAAAAPGQLWFQLYPMRDEAITIDLLNRARASGIDVLVVTVDVPVSSKRERDRRNRFTVPFRLSPTNLASIAAHPAWAMAMLRGGMPSLVNLREYTSATGAIGRVAFMAQQARVASNWAMVDRLRALWPGRLVLKGLMAAADVSRAADQGVDGVILSNHGGRQLDSAPSPVEVIEHAARAADGRLALMLDSGITRGADILRAAALGAPFGFVGRASLYGLASGDGQRGVEHGLRLLAEEIDIGLGQLGCPSVASVTREHASVSGWNYANRPKR